MFLVSHLLIFRSSEIQELLEFRQQPDFTSVDDGQLIFSTPFNQRRLADEQSE